ncbi:histidine phosphatase family protein [Massilia sp. ST3]|uniref:histidine phosphatase family protein n=1 Tax=Massilia sp. ST3 TaxID=2824903 RepID=UPI001B84318A|nr:histidine phosphatase family protein [Massilia sp. ST3]MBQ5949705.1 histidine phosphatase family protein [Massilia sp. ST3]
MLRRRFLALLAAGPGAPLAAAAQDAVLWQRLRAGGHVLLMRHAATDLGIGDPPGFVLDRCHTQRNLSEAGRRDARRIGEVFRSRAIPVGQVMSSRWCRCLDTARLAFGRVQPAPMLDSMFREEDAARRAKLAEVLARAGGHEGKDNLVLVTHDVNIRALVGESVAQGEIVVTDPAGGQLRKLGVLRAHE